MPAKPLNPEQKRDADRLRALFSAWQSARKDADQPWPQEEAAAQLDMTQGALSQYLVGRIPLNFQALIRFAKLIGVKPENISPSLVQELRALAAELDAASGKQPRAST